MKSLKMLRNACTAACVIGGALGAQQAEAFTYSAHSYVQRGLIGHFDGIENGGYGVHVSSAIEWINLVPTNFIDHLTVTTLKSWEWADTHLNLSSGTTTEPQHMTTKRPLDVTSFTIETVARTGSDGMIRAWEVMPYTEGGTYASDDCNNYEAWTSSGSEGYLERLTSNTGVKQSRVKSYPTRMNNFDIHFATTYDSIIHTAHSFVDGIRYKQSARVINSNFERKMSFFSKMTNGRAYSLRIYDRALNEDELRLNDVIDQLRFFGHTPQTVVLPEGRGWNFDENGVLRTANGKVLLRPEESASARAVTGVSFFGKNDGELFCHVKLASENDGVTNAVYFAWGDKDYGTDAFAWTYLRRIMCVTPETEQFTFKIPEGCHAATSKIRARVFTAVASHPFDHRLESIGATGTQWLDTGYYANPKTVADFTVCLNDLSGSQRVFGADDSSDTDSTVDFCLSAYITGGGGSGRWAYSCNDGIGAWYNTGKMANEERTRLQIKAPSMEYVIYSPSYLATQFSLSANTYTCSKTATSSQVIFAVGRKRGTSYERPIKNGVIYSGSYSEDDEFVHTYEPCIVDGRAAFYDSVTDRIWFSSTTTDFVAFGENVSTRPEVGELLSKCSQSVRVAVPSGTILAIR